jgi:hypothetical protein
MKSVILTVLSMTIATLSFSQRDLSIMKTDTVGYQKELQVFYGFLSKNYNLYKTLDFTKRESISTLENECKEIFEIIESKTKYIEEDMILPVYVSEGVFTYIPFDVGGKNYPEVYFEIEKLYNITQRMLKSKNERHFNRMNLKLTKSMDKILNKKEG